ncbi:MAG: flagellar basal body rod protein FlgC [Rhizobiaceae bacterium]
MDMLASSLRIANSGLTSQSMRIRVAAENLANENSTSRIEGGDPYRRKTVSFAEVVDRASGASLVSVSKISRDPSDFEIEFDPSNPDAGPDGNVLRPNVNPIIEMADMREANRSYEANLQVIKQTKDLISMTIDLMRSS